MRQPACHSPGEGGVGRSSMQSAGACAGGEEGGGPTGRNKNVSSLQVATLHAPSPENIDPALYLSPTSLQILTLPPPLPPHPRL